MSTDPLALVEVVDRVWDHIRSSQHPSDLKALLYDTVGGLEDQMLDAIAALGGRDPAYLARARAHFKEDSQLGSPVELTARSGSDQAFELALSDAHFALNQSAGKAAVALTQLGQGGPEVMKAIDDFLASFAERYPGERMTAEVRYARWILTGDATAALEHILDPKNEHGVAHAAAALADLHHPAAVAVLAEQVNKLKPGEVAEALREAVKRLRTQTAPPAPGERMVLLFGHVSRSLRARGGPPGPPTIRWCFAPGP